MRKRRLAFFMALLLAFQPQGAIFASEEERGIRQESILRGEGQEEALIEAARQEALLETAQNGALLQALPEEENENEEELLDMAEAGDEPVEPVGWTGEGGGTQENPYRIYNAEQLKAVSDFSYGYYFKLMNDIDLSGTKWSTIALRGTLDGDGHKISNLRVSRSFTPGMGCLFYTTDYRSTEVRNLTLENVTVNITGSENNIRIGLIGGDMKTLEDCTVTGTVRIECEGAGERTVYIGGMAYTCGYAGGCKFEAALRAPFFHKIYFGGIACKADNHESYIETVFSDCVYSGRISLSGNSIKAAGIAWDAEDTVRFTDCTFDGRFTAEAEEQDAEICGIVGDSDEVTIRTCETGKKALISVNRGRASGISGFLFDNCLLESCVNRGIIKAEGSSGSAAGIVYAVNGSAIFNCRNEGTVRGGDNAAGIVISVDYYGYYSYTSATVSSCTNAGSVNNSGKSGHAGGIACTANGCVFSDCANEGEVKGNYEAGGIAATSGRNAEFYDCFNEGTVAGGSAAGIVSHLYVQPEEGKNQHCLIRGCYNAGEVLDASGSGTAAGISAWLDGDVAVEGCYNLGKVRGHYSSGIVGWLGTMVNEYEDTGGSNQPQLTDCFNLGRVESCGTGGGIVTLIQKGDILRCFNAGVFDTFRDKDDRANYMILGGIAGSRFFEISSFEGEGQVGGVYAPILIRDCFFAGTLENQGGYNDIALGGIMGTDNLVFSPEEESLISGSCHQTLLIQNCYNASAIPDKPVSGRPGGIFGSITRKSDMPGSWKNQDDIIKVTGSYYRDGWKKPIYNDWEHGWNIGAASKTDTELKQKATYENWDFSITWDFTPGYYRYPVLTGPGEGFLQEAWGGGGAKLSTYIIRVVDRDTKAGIKGAYVSFGNTSSRTNADGNARFYLRSGGSKYITVTSPLYETWNGMASFSTRKPYVAELKQEINFCPPEIRSGGMNRLQGNVALVKGKYTFLFDANTSLGMDLTSFTAGNDLSGAIPFKISHEPEKKKIKISFGLDTKKTLHKYEGNYEAAKNLVESTRKQGNGKTLSPTLANQAKAISRTMGVGSNKIALKVYYAGYVTISYATGECCVTESGAVIGVSGSATASYSPVSTARMVTASVSIGAGAQGGFTIGIDPKTSELTNQASINLSQSLSGSVLVGPKDLLQAGVSFGAELSESLSRTQGRKFDSERDLKVQMELTGNLKAVVLNKEVEVELAKATKEIWPNPNVAYDSDDLKKLMKNNKTASVLQTDSATELQPAGAVAEENIYEYASPVLGELSDGTRIAAFLKEDPAKTAGDRQTLYYAVDPGTGFTEETVLLSSNTADYDPYLAVKGNSAYLVWLHATKPSGDEDWSKSFTVMASVFDAGGKTFGSPVVLSSGREKLPRMLRAAASRDSLITAWVENNENDEEMEKGSNTVCAVTLTGGTVGNVSESASGLNGIFDLSLGYEGESLILAYSELVPAGDRESPGARICTVENGTKTVLTEEGQNGYQVAFLDEVLYFTADGMLYRKKPGQETEATGIMIPGSFLPVAGQKGHAVLFLNTAEDGTQKLMISYERGGAFTLPVELPLDASGFSPKLGAVYEEDGSASVFAVRTVSQGGTRKSDRVLDSVSANDLVMDPVLYFDPASVKPDQTVTFFGEVTNHSGQEINQLTLTLKNQNVLESKSLEGLGLSPGNSLTVSVDHVISESELPSLITLAVQSADLEPERNTENNKTSPQTLGKGNLALDLSGTAGSEEGELKRNNDGSAQISAVLKNTGYTALRKVSWNLVMRDASGNHFIASAKDLSMNAGASGQIKQPLAVKQLKPLSAYDTKVFVLQTETADEESDYGDNTAELYLPPAAPESFTVEDGNGKELKEEAPYVMDTGDTAALKASVLPSFAYQEVDFASSDLNVAYVDEEGTLYAAGEGKAEITASTGDGTISRVFPVSVNRDPSGIVYSMSPRSVMIERGEEEKMSFTFTDLTPGQTAGRPEGTITWISLNPDVVTVSADESPVSEEDAKSVLSRATLHARKEGPALVKATIQTSAGPRSAFGVVAVTDSRVKYAAFSEKEVKVGIGKEKQLTLVTSPEAPISDFTLTSNQPEIVKVNGEGVIRGLAEGEAVITASYNKTEEGEEPVTASVKVIVTDEGASTHILIFDPNGGNTIDPAFAVQEKEAGEAFVFPSAPIRAGYDFKEWNTDPEGKGRSYHGSEKLISGVDVIGSLTLYAIWERWPEGRMQVAPIPDQPYAPGKPVTPKLTVYDGIYELTEGVDYKVSFKYNRAAGKKDDKNPPTAVVKGIGNYTGTQNIPFTILPVNLETSPVELPTIYVNHTGRVIKKVPSLKYAGKALKNNTDFTLDYSGAEGAFRDEGTWSIQVTGKGNYTGTVTVSEVITKKPLIGKAKVSRLKDVKYTGSGITQNFTVTYGREPLAEGTDFTAEWKNNTEVGQALLVLTGTGKYAGEKTVSFRIKGEKLSAAKVSGIPKSVVYDGADITAASKAWETGEGSAPVLTVTEKGESRRLTENKDYTVSYTKNRNKGTAKIIFTGMGGYTGTLQKTFKINAYDIKENPSGLITVSVDAQVPYCRGGATPDPAVRFNGVLLRKGTDYTVSFRKNQNAGDTAEVTIKGKGNFKGAVKNNFTVIKQNLERLFLYINDPVYKNKKGAYIPKITLEDLNGKPLRAGTDYDKKLLIRELSGSEPEENAVYEAGTRLTLSVNGRGNYEGSVSGNYSVVKYSLTGANVKILPQSYTGSTVRPGKEAFTVKLNGKPVPDEGYEIVSYGENRKKGKGTVRIHGTGEYGGWKNVSFTIRAKELSFAGKAAALIQSLF